MLIRNILCVSSLLSLVVTGYAEEFQEWQGPAFRLTCLPKQNLAVVEPYYISRMPKNEVTAYIHQLAQQGIYTGTEKPDVPKDLPLTASCTVDGHKLEFNFTYVASRDLAIGNDPSNTLTTFRSPQHCQSINRMALFALNVDGKTWLSEPHFSHDCLEPQIFRMTVYPSQQSVEVCTQSIGGRIEDAPLDVNYSSLSLDEKGNPPMPKVSCQTRRFDK